MILKHRNRAARIAIRAGLLLITAALAGTGCASSYDPVVSGRDGTGNGNMARQPGPPQASQKQKDHADARAHQSLGLSYMRDGRVPLAIRELRAAVELNPKDKWSQLALAEAYRLRDLLPDAEKHALAALKLDPDFHEARLTLSGLYIQMERYPEAVKQTEFPAVKHPIVRTHPQTGSKILYVNSVFVSHIEGIDRDESNALLDLLCRQATVPEYQCRFHWQAGDVAFWDNRATQHYAASDYWPLRRVMERVAIIGDRPV